MSLVTEEAVRRLSNGGTRGPVVVEQGDVLAPSARSYLLEHRIETVYPRDRNGKYKSESGIELKQKGEHMTHLSGNTLVPKDHPRIIFRGFIDRLEAEFLITQQIASAEGKPALAETLGEGLDLARRCMRFDVLGEAVGKFTLSGLTPEQLREHSHYPEKHYGQPHFLPSWSDGPVLLQLNLLRTIVRQSELAAYQAFKLADGSTTRDDIMQLLNRMSSWLWILMIRLKAGK